MAKTVDNYSTIEEFRQKYNELAVDVGEVQGLRPALGDNLVDAVNAVEDKAFYFGRYRYTATANQQTVTGADGQGNILKYKGNRVQVFKNGVLLEEAQDWQVAGLAGAFYYSIQLVSPASVGDLIQIFAYTGSFEGTATSSAILSFFTETLQNTIYNTNTNGIILQGDNSSPTTTLQSGFNIQLAGKTYAEDNISLASGKTLTGNVIGDLTGDVTGNVTGNLTGNVTGNVSGSAGTVTSITTHSASTLSDINYTSAPSGGQVLAWDATNNYWEPVNPTNTTDSVSEGNNQKYFTDTRVNAIINAQDGLSKTFAAGTSDPLDGDINISVNTSEGIKIVSDNVVMDKTITSSAPSGTGSTSSGHIWFVV